MRIKAGDQWFEATPGQPIMVVLTEADRRNIGMMLPDNDRYAVFSNDDLGGPDQRLAWMLDGDPRPRAPSPARPPNGPLPPPAPPRTPENGRRPSTPEDGQPVTTR